MSLSVSWIITVKHLDLRAHHYSGFISTNDVLASVLLMSYNNYVVSAPH